MMTSVQLNLIMKIEKAKSEAAGNDKLIEKARESLSSYAYLYLFIQNTHLISKITNMYLQINLKEYNKI